MRIVTLLTLCAVLCCSQGHKQEDCLNQNISPRMINGMIENYRNLIKDTLPKDNAPFRRILGKLAKNHCLEKLNVADIKRLLDIYDEHVFQKLWSKKTDNPPKLFTDSLARLRIQVEICATNQGLSRCVKGKHKQIEHNLKTQKDLHKAQGEFSRVLFWIADIMNRSKKHEIH